MGYLDRDGGGGFTPGDLTGGGVLNGDFGFGLGAGFWLGGGLGFCVLTLHLLA